MPAKRRRGADQSAAAAATPAAAAAEDGPGAKRQRADANAAAEAAAEPSSGAAISTKALYTKLPAAVTTATGADRALQAAAAAAGLSSASSAATAAAAAGAGGKGGAGALSVQALITGVQPVAASVAQQNWDKKVRDKVLALDQPIKAAAAGAASSSSDAKGAGANALAGAVVREQARAASRARERVTALTAADKRRLRLYALPKADSAAASYARFEPLHLLWRQYVCDLLGEDLQRGRAAGNGFDVRLLKADFHGAELCVVRAQCPTLIGARGLVVLETAQTFKVVTRHNRFVTLPKRNTVFAMALPDPNHPLGAAAAAPAPAAAAPAAAAAGGAATEWVATLYGSQLCLRPADRIAKKFKAKNSIELAAPR